MVIAPRHDELSPLDAMFLQIENASAHMHMGGVFVCEGRPPSQGEFLAHMASRLDRVPRYRQRLSLVPLGLGRPAWVDDPAFDLSHHVRRIDLTGAGSEALDEAAAAIFSSPLDRSRPLWSLDLVEGVAPDRFALVSRTHHSLVDGLGGCDIVAATTDETEALPEPAKAVSWAPRGEPSAAVRLAEALRGQAARSLGLLLDLARPGSEGRRMLRDVAHGLVPLVALGLQGRAPPSTLNSTIGPRRRYARASIELAGVQRIRAVTGGTVNDVLLSVVAGALARLFRQRGVPLRPVRAFVPVSERTREAGCSGNHISAVYCPLPIDEPDPVRRVRAVSAAMAWLKSQDQATGVLIVRHLGEFAPAPVAARAARLEVAFRRFNLVVSNIPGPRALRYLLGRPIHSFHPAIPLASGQTLSIGVLSYAGSLGVGLLGDAERARDLPVLAQGVEDAFDELQRQAGPPPGPAPAPAPKPTTGVALA